MTRQRSSYHRRGGTIVELIAAAAILAVVTAAVGRAAVAQKRQSLRMAREAAALAELPNLMEELQRRPWRELTADAAPPEVDRRVETLLPECQVGVEIKATETGPTGKRLRVSLSWLTDAGAARQERSLVAWVYTQPAGSTEPSETTSPDGGQP
ncbi:MAG: hypothetical protein AAGJ46_00920 [Planctomycetota bacterium]